MNDLEAFKAALQDHDWYYYFSDDQRVFEGGEREQRRLEAWAKKTPQHTEAYNNAYNAKFNTTHFKGKS